MNLETAAPLGLAFLGLLLGMRHATDPDHVIAVTTILSRERRFLAATKVGIVWGLGHTLTVLSVGAAIIVFKVAIPVRLGLAMEFAVAIVLILLGLGSTATLIGQIRRRLFGYPAGDDSLLVHSHSHGYDNGVHTHKHVHLVHHDHTDDIHRDHLLPLETMGSTGTRSLLRSFGVGLIHGLAGSAAIALLILSAIPEPLWATLYLAIFCLGTIVGMAMVTTVIATPFLVAAKRMLWLHQGLVTGSGLLSFGFGLFLAYQLGVVDHLFGTGPLWRPH
ncbi:MAG: high-affinity nickel-transport family protein [Candidatus Binataceae bacterium]